MTTAQHAQPSTGLIQAIKEFEGYKNKPYQDAAGNWTGGYGHMLLSNQPAIIPTSLAETWLNHDIYLAAIPVRNLITVEITQGQFDAMVDFCFNCGNSAFTRSSIWKHINAGRPEAAAAEVKLYNHAGGKVLPGLTKRRAWEASMIIR
jgi:GH24 family phage-related lysozyme (muramidase)